MQRLLPQADADIQPGHLTAYYVHPAKKVPCLPPQGLPAEKMELIFVDKSESCVYLRLYAHHLSSIIWLCVCGRNSTFSPCSISCAASFLSQLGLHQFSRCHYYDCY